VFIIAASKSDSVAALHTETMEGIRSLQQSLQQTYAHFHKVEEVGKIFGETQKKMGEKLDLIHKLLTQ
jgi:hypothetical protein